MYVCYIYYTSIRSLKRTTDEIRNYSFELDLNNGASGDTLDKHRDSTSQVQRQVNTLDTSRTVISSINVSLSFAIILLLPGRI